MSNKTYNILMLFVIFAIGCEKEEPTKDDRRDKVREKLHTSYVLTHLLSRPDSSNKKTRERDVVTFSLLCYLYDAPDYKDYYSAWLKSFSDEESVFRVVEALMVSVAEIDPRPSAVFLNDKNRHLVIIDSNKSKRLADFFNLSENERRSEIEKFTSYIFR